MKKGLRIQFKTNSLTLKYHNPLTKKNKINDRKQIIEKIMKQKISMGFKIKKKMIKSINQSSYTRAFIIL